MLARVCTVVLLACCTAAGAVRAQEGVLLRLGNRPGDVTRYRTRVDTYFRGGPMTAMGGDTSQPTMRVATVHTRTLTAVAGDTLTFSDVVDSATVETPGMPQLGPQMAEVMANRLIGQATTMRMDRRARIYGVAIVDTAAASQGRPGMLGTSSDARSRFLFALPENRVRPGDTWSASTTSGDSAAAVTMTATYRLVRTLSRDGLSIAVVSMTGSLGGGGRRGALTMQFSGQIEFDVGNGRLTSYQLDGVGQMAGPQGTVPARMVLSLTAL